MKSNIHKYDIVSCIANSRIHRENSDIGNMETSYLIKFYDVSCPFTEFV